VGEQPHFHGHRQRLRERFLAGGADALPDYEMLELVLFLAQPRGDKKTLAKALVNRFGSFAGAISADPNELREVPGVGDAAIAAFKVVREAALRLSRVEVTGREVLGSWQAVLDYCRASMGHEKTEQFRVFFLDRKNAVIKDEVQGRGTVDHTPAYPREVVKRALELGATAIIIAHNHPSGDPKPSPADIAMTREIRDAAEKLGIVLHDHIIVGKSGTTSFKSTGLL
jgi:DNA repair protein RadC